MITGTKDLYVDTFNPGDFPDEGSLSVNYQLTVKVRFYSKKIAGTYLSRNSPGCFLKSFTSKSSEYLLGIASYLSKAI